MEARRQLAVFRRPLGREALLAGILAFFLVFFATAAVPLMGRDEGRFAQAAREMLANGELVVPSFAGAPRYDKPILIYWCTMASYAVLGVSAAAARLPANLAATFTVLLIAAVGRRRFGPGAGLTAGLLLATSLTFHLQAKACTADQVMLLPTVVALLALGRILEGRGGRSAALALWVGLGFSILAKGPVGPAVVAAAATAHWALGRRWRPLEAVAGMLVLVSAWWFGPHVLGLAVAALALAGLAQPTGRAMARRLQLAWGLPLLLLITLPWAVAAWRATDGAFFRVAVGHHVVTRSLTALESHGGLPGFYLVTALVAAFPLTGVLTGRLRSLPAAARDPKRRFLVAWIIGPLVLLELVRTKLVHYWLPSYPAAALLAAAWLADDPERPLEPAGRGAMLLGALTAAAVPWAVAIHFDLVPLLVVPAAVAVLPLLALAAAALRRWPARRITALAVAAAAGFLLLLVGLFVPRLAGSLIPNRTAAAVAAVHADGERIVVYRLRDDELLFALPLDVLGCRAPECLAAALTGPQPVLGIAREDELASFLAARPEITVATVEVVRGVDLGRGRWARVVLFRPPPAPPV